MLDWLASSVDPNRAHEVGFAISWHARAMVLGWGVLAPLAVIVARFLKILPGQDWPRELDNPVWWRSHWIGQSIVLGLTIVALVLVMPADFSQMSPHRWLGYTVLIGMLAQVALGLLRGSKGGPTAPAADGSLRGHHYDMTPRRRKFEALHKTLGYAVLFVAGAAILMGLWEANAPRWMWLMIILWWVALICLFYVLQRRGMAVDTYQAIWGDDPMHPGNQRPAPKWGMRRPGSQ
ncbi:cytochrome b561 domain-containing protein [bacterium]|nr:cytochrome b561 domain-containing protein [bacterium]